MRMEIDQRFIIALLIVLAALIILNIYAYQERPQARGHWAFLPQKTQPDQFCGDSRIIAVVIKKEGEFYINVDRKAKFEDVTRELREIYKDRCERVVLLAPDDEVPYQDVMTAIDQLQSKVPYLNVMLIPKNGGPYCGPSWHPGSKLRLAPCR